MKEVADSSQKLSEIAEEQAKAMEQAEAGINQISDVVQSNSANAEETSATSEELSAQAETMNELISKFIFGKEIAKIVHTSLEKLFEKKPTSIIDML